jgi:hypothetical protein
MCERPAPSRKIDACDDSFGQQRQTQRHDPIIALFWRKIHRSVSDVERRRRHQSGSIYTHPLSIPLALMATQRISDTAHQHHVWLIPSQNP